MYYMLGTFYNNVYFLLIFFLIFFAGDEIFAVNGNLLQGLSHSEAIAIFKQIRSGPVVLQTGRRAPTSSSSHHHQPNHHYHHQQHQQPPPHPQPVQVLKSGHHSSTSTQM